EAHSASHPVGVVRIQDGEFSWDDKTEKSTLRGISFEAKPGTLTMVVGSVGSGKSSIIGALVGHMSKRAGSVAVGGKIAYVAQTAWIMNDTVQENVLMGDEVSQLGPDLDILPNGDLTEIGDRGITLSGGQKQRVSIARAVYSDADVYLLDDPLSAVDSHVGRALFEQCIRGPLKDKTVILVTNALHHLPAADNILWLEGGELKAQGTYTELVAKGLDIEELAHMNDSDQEEEAAEGEAAADEAVSGPPSGKGGERVSLSKPNARRSVDKRASLDKKGAAGKGKVTLTRQETSANRNLTGVEEREAGNLSLAVVTRYFDGGGGWLYVALIVMMFAAEQGARVYTDRWVGVWFSDSYNRSTAFYLGIYFALVSLHNQLLTHILRLPKTFFDTNPAGRILNRFSRDTDIMDNTLSVDLIQFAGCIATLTSSLIVIAIATKWFAIALVPLAIIYLLLQRLYIPSARELQRIESVSRSPIYNRFAEAMLGVATIRAYRKGEHFTA
ncbi:ABC transporter, multidrug resistance associated protein, partial [Haematococcus lacustris]